MGGSDISVCWPSCKGLRGLDGLSALDLGGVRSRIRCEGKNRGGTLSRSNSRLQSFLKNAA